MSTKPIAIVAAMEREVRPLVRTWKARSVVHGGRRYHLFENGAASLVCGGIGALAARQATEMVIREVNPERVLSVGFAGALDGSLNVGDVFEPRQVINAGDSARSDTGSGDGNMVSTATIADAQQKIRLRQAYGARAVDMEAAAVAQGAQARGVAFGAIKAISDGADFELPAMDRYVTPEGKFRSGAFAAHIALRPWLWGKTLALARNSSKASHALCDALERYLREYSAGSRVLVDESLTADGNQRKVVLEFAAAPSASGTSQPTGPDAE